MSNLAIPTPWDRRNKTAQHLHRGCRVYIYMIAGAFLCVCVFEGVGFCFGLFFVFSPIFRVSKKESEVILRSRRLCCTSVLFCLWPQPSGVCCLSFYTCSLRCFCSPPLFSSFLALLPASSRCSFRTEPQILKILPLVYLAWLSVFPPLFLAIHISWFCSLIFFLVLLLFIFYKSSHFTSLRSIWFSTWSLAANMRGATGFLKLGCWTC